MDGHNPISAEMSSHNLTSKEVSDRPTLNISKAWQ